MDEAVAARRRRLVLVTVILGTFLGRLDQRVITLALPDIINDFGITVSAAGWIATAYILASAVFVPIWGKLGDTVGRKKNLPPWFHYFYRRFGTGRVCMELKRYDRLSSHSGYCGIRRLPNRHGHSRLHFSAGQTTGASSWHLVVCFCRSSRVRPTHWRPAYRQFWLAVSITYQPTSRTLYGYSLRRRIGL
ncbi:hypothetical protein COV04_03840 [Candidatus Uhrbacteria bacterium CG10_big_fil_rev_8_21_14_0_10_48_11]|uniref:Major facilitator superfamily (MFS) profile domain-containing protein n=1 Tax=Candidatus Uhrbacteria bacterium CG10_big_fil_rev_8_21_14_0_10_48_11 TaxID=1975037 RepID=A0A2M8LE19_9BACT|nr:MAG: hypothetical protein COV04_03840 [Candidatus Uhrbacteria bacterium CG10_big_fil_rev_8_21_14_0_10_48_11]